MKEKLTLVVHNSIKRSPNWTRGDISLLVEDVFDFYREHGLDIRFDIQVRELNEDTIETEMRGGKVKVANWWFDKHVTDKYLAYGNHVCLLIDRDYAIDELGSDSVRGYQPYPEQGVLEYVVYARPDDFICLTKDGAKTFREGDTKWYDQGYTLRQGAYTLIHEIAHGLKDRYKGPNFPDPLHSYIANGLFPEYYKDFLRVGNPPLWDRWMVARLLQTFVGFISGLSKKIEAQTPVTPQPKRDIDDLIEAIIQVESNGKDYAVGDHHLVHKAYGPLQIRKPYIDDVNRVFKTNHKAKDMLGNRDLSIWVFKRYMDIYATKKFLGHEPTWEDIARIHNGGPTGWKRSSTEGYWRKVQSHL